MLRNDRDNFPPAFKPPKQSYRKPKETCRNCKEFLKLYYNEFLQSDVLKGGVAEKYSEKYCKDVLKRRVLKMCCKEVLKRSVEDML